MNLAPIVLFVYNRPGHTRQTLEALSNNDLADQSKLFVFADGMKSGATETQIQAIKDTKKVIREKNWCKEVHLIEAGHNKGLADSIISGVTKIINQYGKVIVLEDDIVTSKGFLKYMNDALELYKEEDKVMHVSAFIYPTNMEKMPNTYFYNVNSCWGWGTWKKAWEKFNSDTSELLHNVSKNYDEFIFNGGQGSVFFQQLEANFIGQLKTWAVKWHSSIYLHNGLCLHPNKSLTINIGLDNSGEHCGIDNFHKPKYFAEFINVERLDPAQSERMHLHASQAIQRYFRRKRNSILQQDILYIFNFMYRKLKKIFSKQTREYQRLKKLPRYTESKTVLLGKEIKIVDSNTFLGGQKELFEKNIYRFNLNKTYAPYIIDCGANIGLSVIYFKQLFPDANILAFEPDPDIFNVLEYNIKSFGYHNVKLNKKAIWKDNTTIRFQQEGGYSGRIPKDGDVGRIIEVDTVSLKDLLINKDVDFLKLDIEGAEYEVIKSCYDILKRVKNIFIEYHSHYSERQTLHEILEILQQQEKILL